MVLGISIKPTIGVGDGLQFSSVPENYYRTKGEKLVDVSRPWFFDFNPYVDRSGTAPTRIQELWNFSPTQYQWPKLRDQGVYLSNAEIHAAVLNVPAHLNRPRLYRFEDYPFSERHKILLQVDGRSHGMMPDHVVQHVIKKYGPTGQLFQIGKGVSVGIPRIETETLWDLAKVIAGSRMLIGMDSGPGWIAACYPDVVLKVVRGRPTTNVLKNWVPLEIQNVHSHWDDRCRQVFNVSEDDIGFTSTYRKL